MKLIKNFKGSTTIVVTIILACVLVLLLIITYFVDTQTKETKDMILHNYTGTVVDKKEIYNPIDFFRHRQEKIYQLIVEYNVGTNSKEYTFDVNIDDFNNYQIGDEYIYSED